MKQIPPQRGFSLIEAMVALAILAIGLLGIALLQTTSLSTTSSARVRALAAIQAANMATHIRSNSGYWTTPTTVTVTPGSTPVLSNAALSAAYTNCRDLPSGSCTPVQVAAYNLHNWGLEDQHQLSALPGSSGSVACAAPTASSAVACTVTVRWRQKTQASNNAMTTQNYQLVVVP